MDSETSLVQLKNAEDLSCKSLEKLDEISVFEANKDAVQPPRVSDMGVSLGPITPELNREIGDFPFDSKCPLSLVKIPPKALCFDSNSNKNDDPLACSHHSSPQTPKEGVFDPFAPGPDDLVLAPRCKKYKDELRSSISRCLIFDSSIKVVEDDGNLVNVAETLSDEEMFESVYENLLEAIVMKQTEGVRAELSNLESESDDVCKTPPFPPRLNGVAETCPGAPMKPPGKSRILDLGLCRKLQF